MPCACQRCTWGIQSRGGGMTAAGVRVDSVWCLPASRIPARPHPPPRRLPFISFLAKPRPLRSSPPHFLDDPVALSNRMACCLTRGRGGVGGFQARCRWQESAVGGKMQKQSSSQRWPCVAPVLAMAAGVCAYLSVCACAHACMHMCARGAVAAGAAGPRSAGRGGRCIQRLLQQLVCQRRDCGGVHKRHVAAAMS